ncbi:response regulator transcription factor [Geminicoccaceae bacterium 1502E]|nr:response regulator transcription factor [Geminicoccaceae bacterium 1502E]
MTRLRILCVEDDEPTRRHLAGALAADARFEVVEAGSLAEARSELVASLPEVMLVDLQLPDGHGLELIRDVRRRSPSVEILVVSIFCDERSVVAAIAAGATGYILKDALPDDIVATVEAVLRGHSPVSAAIARFLLRQVQQQETVQAADAPRLTRREVDILWGIAKGFTYNDIADRLEISRKTVPNYIKSIYRKLGVSSRGEAVFEAVQQRLIRL